MWYKIVYEHYEPITTVFFRLIISSVLLVALTLPFGKLQRMQLKDFKYFALVTLYQPFLYFIGESYGVKFVSSTLSAVIIATIPLFSSIVSALFLNERITKINVVGIFISIAGVIFVMSNKDASMIISVFGVSMLFLAVASAIGYSIVIKKLSDKYNSVSIVTYHNIIGIFYFAPLFFILDFKTFSANGFAVEAWIPLMELAVFGSSFAFIFFTHAIKNLGITKANAFTNAIPVFTAIFAYFVIGEMITVLKMTGIGLVIAGLFMSQMKRLPRSKRIRRLIRPNE